MLLTVRGSESEVVTHRHGVTGSVQSDYTADNYEDDYENDYDDDFEQESEADGSYSSHRRESFNSNSNKYGHPMMHNFSQSRPQSRPHSHNGFNQDAELPRMTIGNERSTIKELADNQLQETLSRIEQLSFSWGHNQQQPQNQQKKQLLQVKQKRNSKPERNNKLIKPHRYAQQAIYSPTDPVRSHSPISPSPLSHTMSQQFLHSALGTPSPVGTTDSSFRGARRGSATGNRPNTYESEALSPVNTAPRRGSATGNRPNTYESEALSPVNTSPSIPRI